MFFLNNFQHKNSLHGSSLSSFKLMAVLHLLLVFLMGSRFGTIFSLISGLSPHSPPCLADPVPVDQLLGQAFEPQVFLRLLFLDLVECSDFQFVVLLLRLFFTEQLGNHRSKQLGADYFTSWRPNFSVIGIIVLRFL